MKVVTARITNSVLIYIKCILQLYITQIGNRGNKVIMLNVRYFLLSPLLLFKKNAVTCCYSL